MRLSIFLILMRALLVGLGVGIFFSFLLDGVPAILVGIGIGLLFLVLKLFLELRLTKNTFGEPVSSDQSVAISRQIGMAVLVLFSILTLGIVAPLLASIPSSNQESFIARLVFFEVFFVALNLLVIFKTRELMVDGSKDGNRLAPGKTPAAPFVIAPALGTIALLFLNGLNRALLFNLVIFSFCYWSVYRALRK